MNESLTHTQNCPLGPFLTSNLWFDILVLRTEMLTSLRGPTSSQLAKDLYVNTSICEERAFTSEMAVVALGLDCKSNKGAGPRVHSLECE